MKTKQLCGGCQEDFYNQPRNSQTGECWMFSGAKVVQLTKVGTWQNPPYKWEPQTILNCHNPKGEHWINKDDPRIRS